MLRRATKALRGHRSRAKLRTLELLPLRDIDTAPPGEVGRFALLRDLASAGIAVPPAYVIPASCATAALAPLGDRVRELVAEMKAQQVLRGRNLDRIRRHVVRTVAVTAPEDLPDLGDVIELRIGLSDGGVRSDYIESRVVPPRAKNVSIASGVVDAWSRLFAERADHFCPADPTAAAPLLVQASAPARRAGYLMRTERGHTLGDDTAGLDLDLFRAYTLEANGIAWDRRGRTHPNTEPELHDQLRTVTAIVDEVCGGSWYAEWRWTPETGVVVVAAQVLSHDTQPPPGTGWLRMEDIDRVRRAPLARCERMLIRELQKKAWYRRTCADRSVPITRIGYLIVNPREELDMEVLLADVPGDELHIRWKWGYRYTHVTKKTLAEEIRSNAALNCVDREGRVCIEVNELVHWDASGTAGCSPDRATTVVEAYPAALSAAKDASEPPTVITVSNGRRDREVQSFSSRASLDVDVGRWVEESCPAYALDLPDEAVDEIVRMTSTLASDTPGLRVEWHCRLPNRVYVRDVTIESSAMLSATRSTMSPGRARGRVLVLHDVDALVQLTRETNVSVVDHGEGTPLTAATAASLESLVATLECEPTIVVAPYPTVGLIPVAELAAGFVFERGAAFAHLAVVLRELGIPAVVQPDATTRWDDGEMLDIT